MISELCEDCEADLNRLNRLSSYTMRLPLTKIKGMFVRTVRDDTHGITDSSYKGIVPVPTDLPNSESSQAIALDKFPFSR